ncbi:TDP-N-acetylfucosamine:lipid II N-acetylfucosaminyltransferase [Enterobacteriaceae bacterium LUAb1]
MNRVIHVLGSDIPHHNQTVLRFFNQVLSTAVPCTPPRRFMVVADDMHRYRDFSALNINVYADKTSLAQAVIKYAQDRTQSFFFHGQFNAAIWLALLTGRIRASQVYWHIWGADLYEDSSRLKFRLFYWLRRMAQRRVAEVFATRGDLDHYQQRYPRVAGTVLYFPVRIIAEANTRTAPPGAPLTLLVGNSGDRSNRHIAALRNIYHQFGETVKVMVPMGYPDNNAAYIADVIAEGKRWFPPENVHILRDKLDYAAYVRLIAACDLGYFIFERQQGIGTLCLLIQANVPFVLHRNNPFCMDLAEQQIPVLFNDDNITPQAIREARQKMRVINKQQIAFFDPAFITGWKHVLSRLERLAG